MSKSNAIQFINHISTILECEQQSLDVNNNVQFTLDGNIGIVIGYAEELNSLIANFYISPILSDDAEILYEILCGAYMWGFTASGNLAIDRENGILTLHRLYDVPANVQQEDLLAYEDLFISLAGAARYWRDYLEKVQGTTENETVASMPDMANMLRI